MKYYNLLLMMVFTCVISTSMSAQFELKKLDYVVVSMSQGESIDNYNQYLVGYFERIELTETLTDKGNFAIVDIDGKQFLQGEGKNETQQNVVFRIQIKTSPDGLTITKIENEFTAQACISKGCIDCAFSSADSCACSGEGECNHSISIQR